MRLHQVIVNLLIFTSLVWSQSTNDEFRATWVITWEHISGSSSVASNQARVREIMQDHVDANMNAVLWQIRQGGTAYYNSSFEPWGYYAGGSYPGYDPLEYAIEQAHLRGLELHAWFNVFAASSTANGTPANLHPEWVCRDRDDNSMTSYRALSPGLEAVREYTLDVVMEVVNNYDIDGMHFDYVRWNEHSATVLRDHEEDQLAEISTLDGQISDATLEALRDERSGRYLYDYLHPYSGGVPSGFSSWEQYWRSSVTEFVQMAHDSIQVVKPWVRLSVAALGKYNWSGWNGYGVVYQDAALWFNEGTIDQLTPMHYHWYTANSFVGMLEGNCPSCWSEFIQPGINAGRLYTAGPGSYLFASQDIWYNHVSVINSVRNVEWVDGFQFFSYGSWEDYVYFEEAGNTIFAKKTKIRDTGLISQEIPAAPSILLTEIDSLSYEIIVSPSDATTSDHWYALYRTMDGSFDNDTSQIIAIRFGLDDFTVSQLFSGNQNHNGNYHYAATSLNRYWNESGFSNAVMTGTIPSFAPQVVDFTIESGDTIPVNAAMIFNFSKSIDISTFSVGFTITPDVGALDFNWSDADRSVSIGYAGNLATGTEYELILPETITDVNGVGFDGNGDGIPGDAYTIEFVTFEADNVGPVLTFSDPDSNIPETEFDVDGVLNMVFDERLDPESVNDSSIILMTGPDTIEIALVLTEWNEHSVLAFKPYEQFLTNASYDIHISTGVTDTLGNPIASDIQIGYTTFDQHYSENVIIDAFRYATAWEAPGYSGSTTGIIGSGCEFAISSDNYLPGSSRISRHKKSAYLQYLWDTSAGNHLIREYLSGGDPRNVEFDNSYILQCYVYGDGSNNQFRFALDEKIGSSWPNHEVSIWYTLDWEGWRLLEWDLTDPAMIGSWIGNGVLDGNSYRIDSFQMRYDQVNGTETGRIYFDNLRIVKKMPGVSIDPEPAHQLPTEVTLYPNYPNPFNPETTLHFELSHNMDVRLAVYDLRGREVRELVNSQQAAGIHKMNFNAVDLAAGVYLIRLETEMGNQVKRMLLLK
ncbi:MAG: family 10 glycosylhydrolase [Candidatus Marinimicrobia bacterium]|nr:family 10 glycosylhydrolase [Candidatus Neomarinimicrobiota bacterium]